MKKLLKSLLDPSFVYALEDLDCKLCLHYGGTNLRQTICLTDECCCKSEIEEAKRREKTKNVSSTL